MRKALAGLAILTLFIPNVLFAQTDTANFFSPVVQQIIHLLQDQIKVYQGQVTDLQNQLAVANDKIAKLQGTPPPVCPSVQVFGSVAPVVSAPVVNPNQAKIDDLKSRIATLDSQMDALHQARIDADYTYAHSVVTTRENFPQEIHDAFVKENGAQALAVMAQRDSLERQLDLLR